MFSVPVVAGDLVFIGSCAGTFYALDKNSGKLHWSYDIHKDGKQRSFHGNPLIAGDLILIGTDQGCEADSIGHVYAFERSTGTVRWKYKSTSVPTDIVQIGQNVYFGSFQDRWSAVNLQSGNLAWSFSASLSNPDCTMIKPPVADESHVYLIGLDGIVYSLDAKSGQVAWKRKLLAAPSTALVLNDKSLFVGTSDKRIHRLNSQNGYSEAEIEVEAQPVGKPTLTPDSILFFLENQSERAGYIISLSRDLSKLRWTQKSSAEWASEQPRVSKRLILAGNCRGELAAFRETDGAQQWKVELKGCIRSVGDSGDILFVGVQEGTVYALRY